MGNNQSEEKITKPQGSTIVSVQHKEEEEIHDCEELRQLKQLPKTVPLRPSNTYPYQTNPNPASNLSSSGHKASLSDNREIRENDIDENTSNQSKNQFLLTPSLIGTTYSNNSSNRSYTSYDDKSVNKSSDNAATQPFNPNTLRPPKLAADGMDSLYKHLREHFTSLAVKVDCNQVSCTFKIQDMDEQLAITRANMIDIDYTTNQLQKTIASMKNLNSDIHKIQQQCHDAVERCNALWKLLPSTPRSLPVFTTHTKQRRVIMEGAMVRLGSYLKGSKRRWVILYIDGLMAYYNEERTELKGVIDLINATEVIPSDISHLMITIKKSNGKFTSWHFKCPSPEHVTKWLDAIRSLHFIRARSKLKYCENIPTQFLRDNTITFIKNKFNDNKQCVFHILHLFNINGYCYQMTIYSDGNLLKVILKRCLQTNNNQQYIDWNIVKYKFDDDDDDGYISNLSFICDDDIITIVVSDKLSILFFATKNCIQCISIDDIVAAIHDDNDNDNNINIDNVETIIENKLDQVSVQRIKTIQDIEIINYNDISVLFICDSIECCLWCFNLKEKQLIKLINTPSPNGVTSQNDTLYITSLQCGIYYIPLKDIDFNKAFNSPSFFSPFIAKTLQIFENIVLSEIISMSLPPSDLQPPESPPLSPPLSPSNPINTTPSMTSQQINTSMISNISKSSSPISHSSILNIADRVPANMLFVIDIECQLYMIRLTDLVLISFGVIENASKLFYYEKLDHLYITRPADNRIDRISNIYHEIVSLRASSTIFGVTPTSSINSVDHINNINNNPKGGGICSNESNGAYENEQEIKENYNNKNDKTTTPKINVSPPTSLQKINAIKPEISNTSNTSNTSNVSNPSNPSNSTTTTTKLKDGNHRKPRNKLSRHKHHHHHHHHHHHKDKKKHLSNADIKALMQHSNDDDIDQIQSKKICFPKSLYLVYQKQTKKDILDDDDYNNYNQNENDELMDNMDDVEMEILVEVDNMLQSYMLSELRQHSKKLLNYTKRNYSFLYLYTSPYDGQSMYRELDTNYESSVPAKNLIQHSSIGPVILVKLKSPTKEQIRKQKERELKIKKRKQKIKEKNKFIDNKNKYQTY